jgi:hypothetical protein
MSKAAATRYPFVKLPQTLDLTLYLIREELKSQKLFRIMDDLGMGDCPYQPHLAKAILAQLNLDDGSDEIYAFYYKLIEKRCTKIQGDQRSLMKQTMKVYVELVKEKERRKGGKLSDAIRSSRKV